MIQAMIFDLDGTQTEKLKALSHARAAVELCPHEINETQVMEGFKEVVGLSRKEVATALINRFQLEPAARSRMAEFGVGTAWQSFVQVRLKHYDQLLADPEILRKNQWPHNVSLLDQAKQTNCKLGLATMSYCSQANRVLGVLDLMNTFDFVASRDDVENGKPDPEIYHLVAGELGTDPANCLVIEDSPSGVKAALAAGMHCIAVTTPFTREKIHKEKLLDERWIVDDPDTLPAIVRQMINEASA